MLCTLFIVVPLQQLVLYNSKHIYMENTGKIIAVLPERSGTSKNGKDWKLAQYVLETQEQYPKRMLFEVFGDDKISQFAIKEGEVVTVSFDVDAREYQGRWYNTIRAWKVNRGAQEPAAPAAAAASTNPVDDVFGAGGNSGDVLDFM